MNTLDLLSMHPCFGHNMEGCRKEIHTTPAESLSQLDRGTCPRTSLKLSMDVMVVVDIADRQSADELATLDAMVSVCGSPILSFEISTVCDRTALYFTATTYAAILPTRQQEGDTATGGAIRSHYDS